MPRLTMWSTSMTSRFREARPGEEVGDVAADVHAHFGTHVFEPANEALLAGEYEALVDVGRNLAGSSVANPDGIGTGLDLWPCELQRNIHTDIHQGTHVSLVIDQVHEEVVEPAKVGGLCSRSLDPAHDRIFPADPFIIGADGIDAIPHPRGFERVRARKLLKIGVILQRMLFAVGHHIPLVDDLRAVAMGLAVGIGHCVHLVDAELSGTGDVGFREHAVVGGKCRVVAADVLGGELHENGNAREKIHRLVFESGKITISAVHDGWFNEP